MGGSELSGKRIGEIIGEEKGRKNWQRCAAGDARTCQDSGSGGHQEATSILPLETFPLLN